MHRLIDTQRLDALRATHERVRSRYAALTEEIAQVSQDIGYTRREAQQEAQALDRSADAVAEGTGRPPSFTALRGMAEREVQRNDRITRLQARRERLQAELSAAGPQLQAWGAYMEKVEVIARSKGL